LKIIISGLDREMGCLTSTSSIETHLNIVDGGCRSRKLSWNSELGPDIAVGWCVDGENNDDGRIKMKCRRSEIRSQVHEGIQGDS
jgi:hypothetical protein